MGNEEQIKVTLQCYKEHPSYIQKALYHLFQLTSSFSEARPDILSRYCWKWKLTPADYSG
ncbi:protein zyg-11 homolog [Rhynchophorus ferrugineus]|uniref:protein zyg-11 homolog n=1 Tax=Rhynchophorus ferrugineus TaxID=354439 RepID=UPI003FCC640F